VTEITERPKSYSDTAKDIARRVYRHENGLLIVIFLALVGVMAALTRGKSATISNIINVVFQSSTRGVAAIGEMFVLLSRNIDISIGGVVVLSFMIGSELMAGSSGFPVGPVVVMLLLGTGIGLVNGLTVTRVGVPSIIVTLAMWKLLEGVAWLSCQGFPITNLPREVAFIGQGKIGQIPMPTVVFIAVVAVAYFILHHTTFGRSVYAVGGNPVSASLCGINTKKIEMMVFVISGFCAAVAGLIILSRIMVGSLTAGTGIELDAIAAVFIGGISMMGGRGTVLGAVIGVFTIGVINNGMNLLGIKPAFQDVVKGIVIISAVAIDYRRRR
jgi:ribose/xylose/arabinose/galactoside ABC-type transport system permease subunit